MTRKKDGQTRADLAKVRRYSIEKRDNRTTLAAFGRPVSPDAGVEEFLESLPDFLKASDFKAYLQAVRRARRGGHPFHVMLGAHVIKVGLSPILIDLMRSGIVTGLSFNGAGLVHELELAFFGGTSEDVQKGLTDGSFGMVAETAGLYAAVVKLAADNDLGLGAAAGRYIIEALAPHRELSVFATAFELELPATLHVGIGTDIVCQHPEYDAVGFASHVDFRILCEVCAGLDRGGVVANIGSAVLLPEVFLKALTVARNLHPGQSDLVTANFDMIEHYRPWVNGVPRPTLGAGKGYSFVGHHELMIPLLAWGLKKYFAAE
jgi:hypothetical protein